MKKKQISEHEHIMHTCIQYARKYASRTYSNPMVGAALAKNGIPLLYGAHQHYGFEHAEIQVLQTAKTQGIRCTGLDLYITLEPCSTIGKTPACVTAIISAGIKTVFIGVCDPNPLHSGKAIALLQKANITVHIGVCIQQCAQLIEDFYTFMVLKRPYISAKIAQSIDGRIATAQEESKWITSEQSRQYTHTLRSNCSALLTGVNTIIADDPQLNTRLSFPPSPCKIILDTNGRIPHNAQIVQKLQENIIIIGNVAPFFTYEHIEHINHNPYDIHGVLKHLYYRKFKHIFIESGPKVLSSFLQESLIDKLYVFIAPKIIGSAGIASFTKLSYHNLNQAPSAKNMHSTHIGNDILLEYIFNDYTRDIIMITKNIIHTYNLVLF